MYIFILLTLLVNEPADTIVHELEQFTVYSSATRNVQMSSSLSTTTVDKTYLQTTISGSLVSTLGHLPGVQAHTIGSSSARPAIRGMGFNRVSVFHDGLRHEGQQWGDDHGLEIDQFAIDEARVVKGPAALLYGADAIGGVLLLSSSRRPIKALQGAARVFFRSNNLLLGTSVTLEGLKNKFYWRANATYQDYADFSVPTDHVSYYSYNIPLHNHVMRNTAGREADGSITFGYAGSDFHTCIKIFETYQRGGFFANAHGLEVRLSDINYDASRRDIDLPYQQVNHLKILNHSVWYRDKVTAEMTIGWQNNMRKEFSEQVSHGYMPKPDNNIERSFNKHVLTGNASVKYQVIEQNTLHFGISGEMQKNQRGGWGFIIPDFITMSSGVYVADSHAFTDVLAINGGVRYDYSYIHILPYSDWYATPIGQSDVYVQRAADMRRHFNSVTWSLGLTYSHDLLLLKFNIGKGFRTPIAKELGANGVNYHIFRYEIGNADLKPEQSYQADVSLAVEHPKVELKVEPYFNYFPNYIYLSPTSDYREGLQVYNYLQSEVIRAGFEMSLLYKPWRFLHFSAQTEYVFARQMSGAKKGYSLPFMPPWNMEAEIKYRFCLSKPGNEGNVAINVHITGKQENIVPPEKMTAGWWTLNMSANKNFKLNKVNLQIGMNAENILNKKYFDHTSFYRLIDVPEPGWNITAMFGITF